jgi:hypothetical protein
VIRRAHLKRTRLQRFFMSFQFHMWKFNGEIKPAKEFLIPYLQFNGAKKQYSICAHDYPDSMRG